MGGSAATADSRAPVARYPLGLHMAVSITPLPGDPAPTWQCTVQTTEKADAWRDVVEGDGAAEAFVDVLRHTVTVPAEGFRVVRLVPPPEATGERAVDADRANHSVVVGERVVVTWIHRLRDREHPAPLTLAHLAEVRFIGVPVTHGILTWRSPSGRELPCAVATGYLPRSRNGWEWCPDLVEQQLGVRPSKSPTDAAGLGPMTGPMPLPDSWVEDFPARIGRLVARLHISLATPSALLPEPVRRVGTDHLRSWHAAASTRLERVIGIAASGVLDDADHVLSPRVGGLRKAINGLADLAGQLDGQGATPDRDATPNGAGVVVQRVHGDLHAGQMVRWPGGLAVVDFDGNPALSVDEETALDDPLTQPAARDIAQLLLSLDHVGRVADERSGFRFTDAVDEWSDRARAELLAAYKAELAHADMEHLLDERLVPAFEAEQVCRELLYAARHRVPWAHAPLAGLRLMVPAEQGHRNPSGRHRADDV